MLHVFKKKTLNYFKKTNDLLFLGKFRFIVHIEEAMKTMKKMGFNSKDIDDVKNIFASTNFYLLSVTIVIVSFHVSILSLTIIIQGSK